MKRNYNYPARLQSQMPAEFLHVYVKILAVSSFQPASPAHSASSSEPHRLKLAAKGWVNNPKLSPRGSGGGSASFRQSPWPPHDSRDSSWE
jgi:hypothetical protein